MDSGWGLISQKSGNKKSTVKIDVKKGKLAVSSLNLAVKKPLKKLTARIGTKKLTAKIESAVDESWDADKMLTVRLEDTAIVTPAKPLLVRMEF